MIGTATFVMLIAATAIADNAYPPCTENRSAIGGAAGAQRVCGVAGRSPVV
jgi:hypothetical protein